MAWRYFDEDHEHSAAAYRSGEHRDCEECRVEHAALVTLERRRRGVKPRPEGWGQGIKTHGTRSRYQAGCRCSDCTAANREYNRQRRQKKKS